MMRAREKLRDVWDASHDDEVVEGMRAVTVRDGGRFRGT
jgi:hypothetical protein